MFLQLAEIFSTGDTSAVDSLFSAEYIDHQRPDWMNETGAEEFKAIVKLARDNMSNLSVSVEGPVIADGDMIAGRLKWASDTTERETIEMLRVQDGMFVEHWGGKSWSRQVNTQ